MVLHGGKREGAGRPVSDATIKAQLGRKLIADRLEASLEPIVAKAITQALEGDYRAREWLSLNAWGRPAINVGVDAEGQPIPMPIYNGLSLQTDDSDE